MDRGEGQSDSPCAGPALRRGRSDTRPAPIPTAQAPVLYGLRSSSADGKLMEIEFRRQDYVSLLV